MRDDDAFAQVMSTLLSIPIGALVLWFTWNHFTDPEHPLRFSYVLVTQVAVATMECGIVGALWLWFRRRP